MFSFLSDFFQKKAIDCFAPIPLEACRITKPYLLEREGIGEGTAILFAVPYFTPACDFPERNLSAYAVGKDYHLFFKLLSEQLLQTLRKEFPEHRFAAFADHSPIDERHAAAMAGLGMLGKNGLLITKKYSSYVFLGEIITDAILEESPKEIAYCEACGACDRVCPLRLGKTMECLSAVTQRKTPLTPLEETALRAHKTVWGCDLCQEVCPHTKQAKQNGTIYTPLIFFEEDTLPMLSSETFSKMDGTAFASRAYSWRGREVISRNLDISESRNDLTPPSAAEDKP
jgi:epoxyqueuosine reductase